MRARWEIAKLTPHAGMPLVVALVAVNAVLGLLPVAFVVQTSVLIGRIPDAVRSGVDSPAWGGLVAVFLGSTAVLLAQQVLAPAQFALGEVVARRVDGYAFDRLMSASLRSPGIAPLEDAALLDELGEAKQRLESGWQGPGDAYAGLLALLARYLQLVGFAVAIGVLFSWLAALGVVVATMTFRYGQRGGLRKYSNLLRRHLPDRRRTWYLRELSTSAAVAKETRVFGLAEWLGERYREAYLAWMVPTWAYRRQVYLAPYLRYTAFGLLVTSAVLGVLGLTSSRGGLTLTEMALVLQATIAASRLGDAYPESDMSTQFGMDALTSAAAFERGVARHLDQPGSSSAPTPSSLLRFDRVGFGYPGGTRPVFDGLHLDIPVGKCTAVVGLNGAGKTTLVKLLARLHDPTTGAVRVDGVDIRTVDVARWRRQLGVIFQHYLRYEATIAENIGFGAVEHADDRVGIEEVARRAGLDEVLAGLPLGLDTPLAAHMRDGVDLSGGQWQRVALARALFAVRHGASVLVLDEPTASLDVRAEARFYDEFVDLTRGVTTILISHRFATVRLADQIVVLEDGGVLEQGSHQDLMRADGRYARLFRLQADRFNEGMRS
ncbi:ATP-binding cassette subfamily B protein [Saccharothrix ecbatanensis]|uniref:ATP-binding cassette subfamily B protein n=1 Tax=Saccharothrix ecbatanensis TaxID=1105145 RepID=A0A7W9HIS5_9PSEU|nr:ABC transporter ATP-binding protein [Saccharothrix ecbatanensis]MBB5803087.1 ATP-binding cassette subfamily B protein [Saccharothrix ecbatanensis]